MAELTVQSERAFQKQTHISNPKRPLLAQKKSAGGRYWKNVGLGVKTPKEAIEGTYIDKKCPFTSDVTIRGRILRGTVISTKMKRTVVVRRDYLHYQRKYNRFEKRHSNVSVHCSPAFGMIKEGDVATIGECRPLSKTVRFNVLSFEKNTNVAAGKRFQLF
eukprot:TRINITY_DN1137_c0_g1_i2.p1 TRINITY_DN1137_c0_g1~~TRINITY_DN1137_c0_g1_i2.p1  ORF type:complete len:161 (+),score=32.84 TRINITY_DN1137_c0_g1_i2:162-644(+)